ncbi:acetylcholinesterase isoform X2 [Anoplophora glabripennis]|uniref:acetylcholinesterase isoform X2 n=1 Tax=Anoplophora glabripennis TaxID=217634 RepID=UPI00087483FB|nr:acetylcholinesterase isoform X2 [Anoplophora glabripennis]
MDCRKGKDPTLVTLPEGQIKGHELRSPNGKVYYAFQEVPYAAPPVGELRFKPPTEHQKWKGVLDTTKNTKICYKTDSFVIPNTTESEDCLYLNVFTPQKPGDSSKAPLGVIVWIHGGGYEYGSGVVQIFKPQFYVEHNIVVVTMNYRLAVLGFLTTEDGVIPGNLGMKDQHFALKWVKKNIHLFGGDPEKITISGESSGAAAVGLHIISPKNKGLFRAAILQSGTAVAKWTRQDFARFYAFELGRSLDPNFKSNDSKELLKLLQKTPASKLTKNSVTTAPGKQTSSVEGEGQIWLPVIEDPHLEGAFLTTSFYEPFRTGNINQVPILIGFNSEEYLLVASAIPSGPPNRAKYFDTDLSNLVGNKYNMTKENKVAAGRKLRQIYTDRTFQEDIAAVIKFTSDEVFSTPSTRHAKLQSSYTDVYMYQFSYKGKMGGLAGAEVAGVRGVGHAEELGYLWDAPLTSDGSPDDPDDLVTRQRLLTLWTNFVKCLNPTPKKDSVLNNVIWEKLTPNNLVYLNINKTLEMQKNPKEYLEWEKVLDTYAIPPLSNY